MTPIMQTSSSILRRAAPQGVRLIDPPALRAALAGGKRVRVVDVRACSDVERSGRRIPGAAEIPAHQLFVRREELPARTDDVVVIACEPIRARAAALTLSLLGYAHVRVLDGGFDAWLAARLPLTTAAA